MDHDPEASRRAPSAFAMTTTARRGRPDRGLACQRPVARRDGGVPGSSVLGIGSVCMPVPAPHGFLARRRAGKRGICPQSDRHRLSRDRPDTRLVILAARMHDVLVTAEELRPNSFDFMSSDFQSPDFPGAPDRRDVPSARWYRDLGLLLARSRVVSYASTVAGFARPHACAVSSGPVVCRCAPSNRARVAGTVDATERGLGVADDSRSSTARGHPGPWTQKSPRDEGRQLDVRARGIARARRWSPPVSGSRALRN